eukprot:TRINITY_DN5213_c0_g1_i3.p1 TRINITY_DN5213_c0_g1~~TRINITY_DN5213_c0_g1_i3.p1  ORF type:complete len:339 (+),score=44.18 TRINITY_DN5213_c0_g1_i3:129-1145(+)
MAQGLSPVPLGLACGCACSWTGVYLWYAANRCDDSGSVSLDSLNIIASAFGIGEAKSNYACHNGFSLLTFCILLVNPCVLAGGLCDFTWRCDPATRGDLHLKRLAALVLGMIGALLSVGFAWWKLESKFAIALTICGVLTVITVVVSVLVPADTAKKFQDADSDADEQVDDMGQSRQVAFAQQQQQQQQYGYMQQQQMMPQHMQQPYMAGQQSYVQGQPSQQQYMSSQQSFAPSMQLQHQYTSAEQSQVASAQSMQVGPQGSGAAGGYDPQAAMYADYAKHQHYDPRNPGQPPSEQTITYETLKAEHVSHAMPQPVQNSGGPDLVPHPAHDATTWPSP